MQNLAYAKAVNLVPGASEPVGQVGQLINNSQKFCKIFQCLKRIPFYS